MTRRIAIRLAAACLAVVVLLYALGWALSRPEPVAIGPAPASLDAESVTFSSQSGSEIHGWLSRAPTATGAILLLPGVHANRAAARDPKELWLIPNAAHVDFLRFAGDEYPRRVTAFVAAALKPVR